MNQPIKGQGGAGRGQGRKPSPNPATKLATIKMTPEQHTQFIELGGSRWVKGLIDADIENRATLQRALRNGPGAGAQGGE